MSTRHQYDSTLGISGRGANLIYTRKDWIEDTGQKLYAQAEHQIGDSPESIGP